MYRVVDAWTYLIVARCKTRADAEKKARETYNYNGHPHYIEKEQEW